MTTQAKVVTMRDVEDEVVVSRSYEAVDDILEMIHSRYEHPSGSDHLIPADGYTAGQLADAINKN